MHIWQSCLRFRKSRVNNRITHGSRDHMEFFSTKKVHLFAYQQHVQVHLFFVCLRFKSVVVKRIKNIHLFFLNPLMCFFLWSFRFSRFCPFQYILVIPNNCCLHHLPYPKGDKIGCLGQPYLRVCVKVKIIKKPHFLKA